MAKTTNKTNDGVLTEREILEVSTGEVVLHILGETPLIMNRKSEQVRQKLLLPPKTKTKTEKETTLLHDPRAEYRDSTYRVVGDKANTLLAMPAPAFKNAMASAAIDIPEAVKAVIARHTWVTGYRVEVYGVPQMLMSDVVLAGQSRAPAIRTRAILPEWACKLVIRHTEPLVKPGAVARLMAAAGVFIGVGDWRQQKGSGNHGLFRIVDPKDSDYKRIVSTQGREAQVAEMEGDTPTCYDDETQGLYEWFVAEAARREMKVAS